MKFLVSGALPLLLLASVPAWGDSILFDDLSNPNFSMVAGAPSSYDAVQLDTDGNTYTITQATLVLQASFQVVTTQGLAITNSDEIIGAGQLSIYDSTLANNLGTFTGPSQLTTSLGNNVFTDSGIVLQPNTEYWLVFQVTTGTVNWGVEAPGSTGTGPLFDPSYSTGSLGGGFNDLIFYPTQTQLLGTIATSVTTPEPGTIWFGLSGLCLVLWLGRTRFSNLRR